MKKIKIIIMEICSINGKAYENKIWENCVKLKTKYNENFCKIEKNQLGGCSNRHDIVCYYNKKNINIEIKKFNSPDWTQMTLYPIKGKWKAKYNSRIPNLSKKLLENLINNNKKVFNKIPKFYNQKITHIQWNKIKQKNSNFNDIYIDCPSDIISKLYKYKGCHYIQISKYGLYHLGNDICNFNVPLFECQTRLRIRVKIHCRQIKVGKNMGKLRASVVVSARPKCLYRVKKSDYSLDDLDRIPLNLKM
jgi:hypothetical protein